METVGWGGTALILGAYAMNNLGVMEAGDVMYKLMNVVGAVGVGYNSFEKKAWPSVALNAAWLAFGLIGFFRS